MDAALVAARFAHFASLMSLFGACFYAGALSPPVPAAELRLYMRWTAAPLAALALASALVWGALAARAITDGPLDAEALAAFAETAFGHVWLVRLAALAALIVLTLFPGPRWRAAGIVSGAALASLALVGHTAVETGALGALHRGNRVAHLLATAGWFGGLPPFLVSLRAFGRNSRRLDALAAMQSFSRVGHFAVAAVFLTGATDAALTVGVWPWPPATPYLVGLDGKILVVAAMTGLALFNRYALAPRAGRSAAARTALAAGAVAEIVLAALALALVSIFATLDPH